MFDYRAYVPHGITFTDINTEALKHTWSDWRIVPTSRPVFDPPEVRRITQEIPGADGLLDLSRSLTGDVNYNNRAGSFEFYVENKDSWADVYSDIQNFLHGKEVKIILDDDPDFFYKGTAMVDAWASDVYASRITVNADVHPYKFKNTVTEVARAVSGSAIVTCSNLRMAVVPEITASAAMSLAFGTETFAIPAGTSVLPELYFVEGDNIVTVTGTGNMTFRYQEGSL